MLCDANLAVHTLCIAAAPRVRSFAFLTWSWRGGVRCQRSDRAVRICVTQRMWCSWHVVPAWVPGGLSLCSDFLFIKFDAPTTRATPLSSRAVARRLARSRATLHHAVRPQRRRAWPACRGSALWTLAAAFCLRAHAHARARSACAPHRARSGAERGGRATPRPALSTKSSSLERFDARRSSRCAHWSSKAARWPNYYARAAAAARRRTAAARDA